MKLCKPNLTLSQRSNLLQRFAQKLIYFNFVYIITKNESHILYQTTKNAIKIFTKMQYYCIMYLYNKSS